MTNSEKWYTITIAYYTQVPSLKIERTMLLGWKDTIMLNNNVAE